MDDLRRTIEKEWDRIGDMADRAVAGSPEWHRLTARQGSLQWVLGQLPAAPAKGPRYVVDEKYAGFMSCEVTFATPEEAWEVHNAWLEALLAGEGAPGHPHDYCLYEVERHTAGTLAAFLDPVGMLELADEALYEGGEVPEEFTLTDVVSPDEFERRVRAVFVDLYSGPIDAWKVVKCDQKTNR